MNLSSPFGKDFSLYLIFVENMKIYKHDWVAPWLNIPDWNVVPLEKGF